MNIPDFEYVPNRDSEIDRASLETGSGFALVADHERVLRYDVERECPVDEIPAMGWVS